MSFKYNGRYLIRREETQTQEGGNVTMETEIEEIDVAAPHACRIATHQQKLGRGKKGFSSRAWPC